MLKNNNIFKKNKEFFLPFICTFCLILSLSIFVSFSNMEVQEVIVKSMTPVYDENSTVVITEDNGVIFNDKDQVVKYNIVLENTQNYDVKINDIKLSTPSEEFLKYEIEGIDKEDVIKANETKELVVSFKTVKMKGWGRNFSDELITNITFDKIKKSEKPIIPDNQTDIENNKNNTNIGTGDTESDTKDEVPETNTGSNNATEITDTNITDKEPVNKEEETVIVPDSNDTEEDVDTKSESIKTEHELKPVPETKEENTDNTSRSRTILIIAGVATGITGVTIVLLNKNKFAKYTMFIIVLGSTLTITNAEDVIQLPITLNVSYKSQNVMKPSSCVLNMKDKTISGCADYWNYGQQIKNIYIENEVNEINEYVHKFDVTEEQNGRVTAYLVANEENSNYYDLYLQADGCIYPNTNASFYFANMVYLTSINNLKGLDTSEVTDMSIMFGMTGMQNPNFTLDLSDLDTSSVIKMMGMFGLAGASTQELTLDLSNFNTSNVTDMSYMFYGTGSNSKNLTLELSNIDTSNVTDMSYMFSTTGKLSETVKLDLSNIDTSNVTNMQGMFYETGYNSTEFTLDLSNMDASSVTNMSYMFYGTGYNSTEFTLNLSNMDVSSITDMSGMFSNTGYNSTTFTLNLSNMDVSSVTNMSRMFDGTGQNSDILTLDLSNFDTSNVTNMSHMFSGTGKSSENFTLDISNFDTSNVTNMSYMFYKTGYNNPNFTLDISNFDTSNVTDMSYMFYETGNNSTTFTLDLSNFDTSNVTNMSGMFSGTGENSDILTLDLSNFDTNKVTNMNRMFYLTGVNSSNFTLDVSNFDTSNVTNMFCMFFRTGENSSNFSLDVSNFDTSKVTDMSGMFYRVGYNNPSFILDVSNFDTSKVTDMDAMFYQTGYNSTIFTLDVSDFDTSNVTDMSEMFLHAGFNSTKLNTSITIRNPNVNSYNSMFSGVAIKTGSQITVNYTKETSDLVDKMIATKSYGSNVVKGKIIVDVDNLSIGDEIHIENEKFNVISQTDDTVTMLAQYNLGTDYKQNTTYNYVAFSDTNGWEFEPGPKEIDIQTWSTTPKTYVNEYVTYLQGETGDTTLSGDLITLTQLKALGCTINDDYSYSNDLTCANSQYADWLVTSQRWWTQSALPKVGITIWHVSYNNGVLSTSNYTNSNAIRPIITISKKALKNYLKT